MELLNGFPPLTTFTKRSLIIDVRLDFEYDSEFDMSPYRNLNCFWPMQLGMSDEQNIKSEVATGGVLQKEGS